MIENGIGVCRCLFNCSSEENQVGEQIKVQKSFSSLSEKKVCGSNGIVYENLCQLERDRCHREQNFQSIDPSYCKLRLSIDLIDKYFLSVAYFSSD